MNERRGTRRNDQAAVPQSRESIDCTLDCIGLARVISNATPRTRVVSGSKRNPFKYCVIGMMRSLDYRFGSAADGVISRVLFALFQFRSCRNRRSTKTKTAESRKAERLGQ
jgi:hypothetical protein